MSEDEIVAEVAFDWEAEQQRLMDARDLARSEVLRLEPGPEPTTPDDLEDFGTAIERSREAEARWSEFLQRRRTEDPSWK